VATSARVCAPTFSLSPPTAGAIVVQPEPPIAELLAKNPILFAKVVNDVQLTLIHPSGDRDQ
jgi:hypothetical protein